KKDSPYNTYLHEGMPPTPICAPSIASIKAALEPEQTDYLYFWITESEAVFSKTYEEHQAAINNAS
ncbi:MAG: endolytic transglycosylase MltG, partial [Olegusella sp.]|nr:endolytic transglycosylase MltG [Olegusella sp.]